MAVGAAARTGVSGRSRHVAVAVGIVVVLLVPIGRSNFFQGLAADAFIAGIVVLSLVVLTGLVGQISFCQYSFAAVGALTVGSLVGGHHWSFWAALPMGVLGAALVGVIVGIPALRLSGLFLAILTVAVALFFDRFLLSPGTWDSFSGGISPWKVGRPSLFGLHLDGAYTFFVFVLVVFLLLCAAVWNLRTGKTGRVLRGIRDSEIAASTMGLDLTAWKLAAFGLSAAIAGLAGGLLATSVGSVSPPSFDLLHSLQIAAIVTVMGPGSVTSAAAGGVFFIGGTELLRHTPLSARWFPLILGVLLIAQLVYQPDGAVTEAEHQGRRLLSRRSRAGAPSTEAA
jgi:branched-chain amino acid transport system permease protein